MYETPVISQRRTLEAELTEVPFLLIQLRRFATIVLFSCCLTPPKEGRPTLWEFSYCLANSSACAINALASLIALFGIDCTILQPSKRSRSRIPTSFAKITTSQL